MKLLYIEDDDSLRQLYILCLENLGHKLEILEAITSKQAIEYLEKHDDIDFILSDYNLEQGTGGEVYQYLLKKERELPFFLFTTEQADKLPEFASLLEDHHQNRYMRKPKPPVEFRRQMGKYLEDLQTPFEGAFAGERDKEFRRVRTICFLKFANLPTDVYIRLSGQKYVKLFNKGESYLEAEIRKYLKRNQHYLFIPASFYDSFLSEFSKTSFLNEDDQGENAYQVVGHLLRTVGVSQKVLSWAERTTTYLESDIKKEPDLRELLKRHKEQKNYLYDHCYLVAYVCSALSTRLKWEWEDSLKKLIYASIFHDSLLEDPELAYMLDMKINPPESYTQEDIKEWEDHPLATARILESSSQKLYYVDTIVRDHHELPDGSGFPRHLNAHQLPQISAVFILAHTFVNELYRTHFNEEEFVQIVSRLAKNFDVGSFKGPYQALREVMLKE